MKRSLLSLALLLAVPPAAASAAPFGEVAFRPVGGTATCLRATGAPGELVRSTSAGAQFLQAGAGGLTPVADVAAEGSVAACPQAAARPNGAGIVAFAIGSEGEDDAFVRVSLREPGGGWGAHTDVAPLGDLASEHPLAADVSERGDALVAVAGRSDGRLRILAARRAPGAAFGTAETLFDVRGNAANAVRVAARLTAGGDAIVAWSVQTVAGKPRELWVAIAPAGAAFGAPAKLGTLRTNSAFSLAVDPGGRALLAFAGGDDVRVSERTPGTGFGPPTRVGAADDRIIVVTAAALRSDGGAVVAWNNSLAGDVQAVVRAQPGPFGPPVTLAPKSGLRFPKALLELLESAFADEDSGGFVSNGATPDDDGGNARASITADGRAVVTWAGTAQRDGIWWSPPMVATVPLTGGSATRQAFGSELSYAGSTTGLTIADGTLGMAWGDNHSGAAGRLHLALEGVPDGADPAPPTVTVTPPKRRVLRADESLRLRVRCSAACDVRIQAGLGFVAPGDEFSLARAGERTLTLSSSYTPLATLRGGPVKLSLRYAAPGARRATARDVTLRLRRLPDVPNPKILDAVARRDGDEIAVSWRTDRDVRASAFSVYGTRDRSDTLDAVGFGETRGSGRRFRARIADGGGARYVSITVRVKGTRKLGTTVVRVRG